MQATFQSKEREGSKHKLVWYLVKGGREGQDMSLGVEVGPEFMLLAVTAHAPVVSCTFP